MFQLKVRFFANSLARASEQVVFTRVSDSREHSHQCEWTMVKLDFFCEYSRQCEIALRVIAVSYFGRLWYAHHGTDFASLRRWRLRLRGRLTGCDAGLWWRRRRCRCRRCWRRLWRIDRRVYEMRRRWRRWRRCRQWLGRMICFWLLYRRRKFRLLAPSTKRTLIVRS